jgi:hypothetical protein
MDLSISKDSPIEIDRYGPFREVMYDSCQDIWLQLNEIGLTSLPDYLCPGPSRERFPDVLQYFTEFSRVKTISI